MSEVRPVPLRVPRVSRPDVVVPGEDEGEAVAHVIAASINVPLERTVERSSVWHLQDLRVARVDGHPIPIGPLSAMYSGFLRRADAVALGIVDPADPAVPAPTSLLAGPEPWNPWWS